jgi:hypothetical protein
VSNFSVVSCRVIAMPRLGGLHHRCRTQDS